MGHCYIMDLERTIASGTPCYWKRNRHGYTYKIEFAGLFPQDEARIICKGDRSKATVFVPEELVFEILGKELKEHENF
jgi:hypothetical protein